MSNEQYARVNGPARVSFWRFVALVIAFTTVVGVAVAFFQPWLADRDAGNAFVRRYRPAQDGLAQLYVTYDADGQVTAWISSNLRRLPAARALTSHLRPAHLKALKRQWQAEGEDELDVDLLLQHLDGDAQLFENRTRKLAANGKITEDVSTVLRTEDGDYLIGSTQVGHEAELTYEPPLQVFHGNEKISESKQVGSQRYSTLAFSFKSATRIVARESVDNEAGQFADCVKLENVFEVQPEGKPPVVNTTIEWFAAGIGTVEWRRLDEQGKLLERGVIASGPGVSSVKTPPPIALLADSPRATTATDAWELTLFGKVHSPHNSAEGTMAPVVIPTKPPLLLAAAQEGDLFAMTADGGAASQAWTFHPHGTILSPPCWDSQRACLYFGSTDKRLYAVDARGFYRWSFVTGDNVPGRPVVVNNDVIFGSEDGRVYAVDADQGTLRWKYETGGPVASSPVVVGETVVIGSDDGGVYAFNPQSGDLQWSTFLDHPVEVPLIHDGDQLLVATYGGALAALNAADGRLLWSVQVGGAFTAAPAVNPQQVMVVENGRLSAFDRTTGARLWRVVDQKFVAPPVVIEQSIFVADSNGHVHQLDLAGKSIRSWQPDESSGIDWAPNSLRLGLSLGGDSLWMTDKRGNIVRLGPEPLGPKPLRPRWTKRILDPPYASSRFNLTPQAYGDRAVVVDDRLNIFVADPSTGEATHQGSIGDPTAKVSADMTVAGNVLLANIGANLHATRLPEGTALWKFDGGGVPFRPAEVFGETAFWLVQHSQPLADGSAGTLFALNVQSGEVRWRRPIETLVAAGGIVAGNDKLFVSTPPMALTLNTGEPVWRATDVGATLGGPALNDSGTHLYIGTLDDKTGLGGVAALNTHDGKVTWRVSLGATTLNPMERPWFASNVVVAPLWSGEIVALSAEDGKQRWSYKPTVARRGGITVSGNHVWFMQQNSELACVDLADGQLKARFALDVDLRGSTGFAPRPLVLGKHMIVPFSMVLMGFEAPR
jgi:outer membrane protein assembly factor BamB